MFMSMISHLLSAWFAFLLPSYATWKALAHRPVSEPDLERWCMYWAVVGAFVAFEYVTGWILDWVPFYWEARTVFLLFLSLPQTQGSTWVFTTYFQPFLVKNQADIDANIAAIQTNSLAFLQSRLQVFWQTFWDLATKASANANGQARPGAPGAPGAPAPAGAAPGTNYVDAARSLWASYGPSIVGAAQQAMKPATTAAAAAAAPSAPSTPTRPGASPYDVSGSSSSVQANGFSPSPRGAAPPFPEPQLPTA